MWLLLSAPRVRRGCDLDFDFADYERGADSCSAWVRRFEDIAKHLVPDSKVFKVDQMGVDLHHMVKREAKVTQNEAEVFKCESSLTGQVDVGYLERVKVNSSHAAEEVQVADLDGGGVLDVVVRQRVGDFWC